MPRTALVLVLALILGVTPAWAITYDEIPDDVRRSLPEFLLLMIDPAALAYLSVDDLREFARAYDEDRMRFIADVRIEESGGPLPPDLATLILQIPQGAPFIEERFVRIAMGAYGQGVFSDLSWAVYENTDGSVDIHLWYESRDPVLIAPDISNNSLAGFLYGIRYEDYRFNDESKQLKAGLQFSEDAPDEPRINFSYTDSTLNRGRNSYFVSGMVSSDWRQRLAGTSNQANIRSRTGRLDGGYSWHGTNWGGWPGATTLGAGVYDQEFYVLAGDPTMGGTLPRSAVDQTGTGGYLSLAFSGSRQDMMFTPRRGYSFRFRAEQHLGDFELTRGVIDLRKYMPVNNILGIETQEVMDNERIHIRRMFPTASFAVQFQTDLATGDVPYSQEVRLDSARVARGYGYDSHAGTKLLQARAEYRFNLDKTGESEAFVFTDHAGLGEDFKDMESFNSYGLGTVFTVPIYGGFKLGGFYGWAFDGTDQGWGLNFGYQF